MTCPTPPDPEAGAPRHRDDPTPTRAWWLPAVRTSVLAACVGVLPHMRIELPFKNGAWMLHTAATLIFVVGAIDSLFLLLDTRRKS